eukprot:TRINITY_DN1922_c0_g1_i1.p1 TRINITY_DN1922_c0_g1~~TRINITY_DN1922_c0_g1_i1.p1  ORF type:complete len:395 (+),score=119.20 TRINITY_DN1922_c0_g1_i1:214-1398(+)
MAGFLTSLKNMVFGSGTTKPETKIVILGLDAAGKTTLIYKLKLGEVVTTVPTIGFNLESIEYKNLHFDIWDIGGCDKIGPLIRLYLTGTDAVIWMVDSNDRERICESVTELDWVTKQEELPKNIPILIYCNKIDLPHIMSVEEITHKFGRGKTPFEFKFQACCAITGDGLFEGLDWLSNKLGGSASQLKKFANDKPKVVKIEEVKKIDLAPNKAPILDASMSSAQSLPPSNDNALPSSLAGKVLPPPTSVPSSPSDSLTDDEFVAALEDCTLQTWDHKSHLRIAFLYLTRLGRREGVKKIRSSIQNYIENSGRTNKTWHETMTYFWIQMVDYARFQMKEEERGDFEKLLEQNIHLMNGGLFLQYYSKELMLLNQDSRKEFALPDIQPLPSIKSQ